MAVHTHTHTHVEIGEKKYSVLLTGIVLKL